LRLAARETDERLAEEGGHKRGYEIGG
jgi:hypothetical protein